MAPISPGYGARVTGCPKYCSSAHSTASFLKVPPCTTTCLPSIAELDMRTTFVNTLRIIERHSPAIISSGVRPFFCSVIIVLFINTVQRLPKSAGCCERNAASAMRSTGMPSAAAKPSKNEPQPDEQASFSVILVTTPPSIHIAFMSCPPISSTKLTSGTYVCAAAAWATVSTV